MPQYNYNYDGKKKNIFCDSSNPSGKCFVSSKDQPFLPFSEVFKPSREEVMLVEELGIKPK
jgi:hypothetical protein